MSGRPGGAGHEPVPLHLTTPGGQIRAFQAGSGPDLAVLAGPILAAAVVASRLARDGRGWRITVFELPGIGGSSDHEAATRAEMAAALAAAIGLAGIDACALAACDLAAVLLPEVAAALPISPIAILTVGGARAAGWARTGTEPPGLAPRTDGTHLTALWSFLRDRHLLRPDDPGQPDPDGDPIPDAADLDATLVAAAVRPERYGKLWRELARGTGAPGGRDLAGLAGLAAALPATTPGTLRPPAAPTALPDGRIWHQSVETARGRMHLRRAGGEGRPLLVIPTGGGSSSQFAPVVQGLSRGRQAFSVDYLGNGLSDKPDRAAVTIGDLADDMAALVEALGFPEVDVWGSHTGAVVGLELALRHPGKVGRLVMEGPVFVAADFQADLLARYFPPLAPDPWGRHLQLVWNWRRDMFLFWPWYRVDRATTRRLGLPGPQHLHDYAIGILESGRSYDGAYRAAFAYSTASRLPGLTRPALVTAGPNDMLVNALAEARALALPGIEVRETPTTLWWPDPDPDEAAATLAIYEAFLAAG